MSEAAEKFLTTVTSIPPVAGFLVVVLVVVALAKFTDSLEKIHGFYHKAFGKRTTSESAPAWRAQFESLRRNVIYCNPANDLPVQLNKLRLFFLETGLIERSEVNGFFTRWLSHPFISMGMPVLNVFSLEEIVTLKKELAALQL